MTVLALMANADGPGWGGEEGVEWRRGVVEKRSKRPDLL
jgi:hypothetical protein